MVATPPLPSLFLWPPEIIDDILKSLHGSNPDFSQKAGILDVVSFGSASSYSRGLALRRMFSTITVSFKRKEKTFRAFHDFLFENQKISPLIRKLHLSNNATQWPGDDPILETQLLGGIINLIPRLDTLHIRNVRIFASDMPKKPSQPVSLTQLVLTGIETVGHQSYDDVIDVLRMFSEIKRVELTDVMTKDGETFLPLDNLETALEGPFPTVQHLELLSMTDLSVHLPVFGQTSGTALASLSLDCTEHNDVVALGDFLPEHGQPLKSITLSLQDLDFSPQGGVSSPEQVTRILGEAALRTCASLHHFKIVCTVPVNYDREVWGMMTALMASLPRDSLHHLSIVMDYQMGDNNPWDSLDIPWHAFRHACRRFRGLRTIELRSDDKLTTEIKSHIETEMADWHKKEVLFTDEVVYRCFEDACPYHY